MPDAEARPPEAQRRRRLVVAVAVGLSAGLLLVAGFAGKRRVPPLLPRDEAHLGTSGLRDAEVCLACHARDTPLDRGRQHTGREDCWNCHPLAGP